MKKDTFKDPTPVGESFLGDLKFGRCFGLKMTRNDYLAYRDKNGEAINKPVVPLTLVREKDNEFWAKVQRPRVKTKLSDNTDKFRKEVLISVSEHMEKNRIKFNLSSLRLGKERLVAV